MEGIGSGAVTAPFTAAAGCRRHHRHRRATRPRTIRSPRPSSSRRRSAAPSCIVMDPRGQALTRHATQMLQFKPGRDVAMLNAMLHTIIEEGLHDQQYVQAHTEDFDKLREHMQRLHARRRWRRSAASTPRRCARSRAPMPAPSAAIIFWGMGISQHTHGTDNARCLIALALITGQVGRPGTGLHPLRGQNNVQGASDAGLIPMVFPDYQSVDEPERPRQVRGALGHHARSDKRGLTVVEIMDAMHARRDQGHVHHGREPGDVRPRRRRTRARRWRSSSISSCRTSS